MLSEYIAMEVGGGGEGNSATMISRLVIVGNSLAFTGAAGNFGDMEEDTEKKPVGSLVSVV
jgi:hypothetical protein